MLHPTNRTFGTRLSPSQERDPHDRQVGALVTWKQWSRTLQWIMHYPSLNSHTVFAQAALLLVVFCTFHDTYGEVYSEKAKGVNGETGYILSPSFPNTYGIASSKEYRNVYSYLINNTSPMGRVQLVFLDYDLHPNSVLRIYLGNNASSSLGTEWRSTPPPIYNSHESNTLFVVFKPGFDASPNSNTHLGFRASYSLLPAELTESSNLTSSLCSPLITPSGDFYRGDEGKMMMSYQLRPNGYPYQYHCNWRIQSADYKRTLYLAVKVPSSIPINWIDGGNLEIRSGGTSIGSLLNPSNSIIVNEGQLWKIYIYRSHVNNFHVSFKAAMTSGDSLLFAYHSSERDVKELAKGLAVPAPSQKCAYKGCWSLTRDCVMPWESCVSSSQNPTCDDLGHNDMTCNDVAVGCYNSTLDTCDDIIDCVSNLDEKNCTTQTTFGDVLGGLIGIAVIGFIIFMVLKVLKELCKSCYKCVRDFFSSMRDCLQQACSSCSDVDCAWPITSCCNQDAAAAAAAASSTELPRMTDITTQPTVPDEEDMTAPPPTYRSALTNSRTSLPLPGDITPESSGSSTDMYGGRRGQGHSEVSGDEGDDPSSIAPPSYYEAMNNFNVAPEDNMPAPPSYDSLTNTAQS